MLNDFLRGIERAKRAVSEASKRNPPKMRGTSEIARLNPFRLWKRDPVCQDNTACHNTLVYQDVKTAYKTETPQDSEYCVKTWERRHELRRFFVFQDAVSQDTFSCSKTRCLKSSFHSACQDAVSQVVAQCLTVHIDAMSYCTCGGRIHTVQQSTLQ